MEWNLQLPGTVGGFRNNRAGAREYNGYPQQLFFRHQGEVRTGTKSWLQQVSIYFRYR